MRGMAHAMIDTVLTLRPRSYDFALFQGFNALQALLFASDRLASEPFCP